MRAAAKKLSRAEFARQIEELKAQLEITVSEEVSRFPAGSEAQANRKSKASKDFEFFCSTYFPHYFKFQFSGTHKQITELVLLPIAQEKEGDTYAVAAPRGEGKSTLISMAFVIWCDLFGYKRFPLICSEVYEQAAILLLQIKVEYESNPRLSFDFKDKMGSGRIWRENTIITPSGMRVDALGAKQKVRGRKNGPVRPDLFIGDDLESDEHVKTKEQRDKLESWLDKAVYNAGDSVGSFDVLLVGTVLHYDSVLNRKLNSPDWVSIRLKSLIQWPTNMDHWNRWEMVYKNQGKKKARAYYDKNQTEMDAGAVVSWPEGRPLYRLMVIRVKSHEAFNSEQQNDPLDAENATFTKLHYWTETRPEWPVIAALDPSMGKHSNKGDPSAIIVGRFDPVEKRLYVIYESIKRRPPSVIITAVIGVQLAYNPVLWFCENNAFQEFFRTQLVKDAKKKNVIVPMMGAPSTEAKDMRILSIQPAVQDGDILFTHDAPDLISQLTHYPKAAHDDGPDALEMLYRLGVTRIHSAYATTAGIHTRKRKRKINRR